MRRCRRCRWHYRRRWHSGWRCEAWCGLRCWWQRSWHGGCGLFGGGCCGCLRSCSGRRHCRGCELCSSGSGGRCRWSWCFSASKLGGRLNDVLESYLGFDQIFIGTQSVGARFVLGLAQGSQHDDSHMLEALGVAHDVEHFKPWLYFVTKNHCLMKLRRKKGIHGGNMVSPAEGAGTIGAQCSFPPANARFSAAWSRAGLDAPASAAEVRLC